MKPKALFLITSDPARSSRPAEAIRIAAGIGAWGQVEVTLYLAEAATRALDQCTGLLGEAGNFTQFLPLLAAPGRPVFLQSELSEGWNTTGTPLQFECLNAQQLARLALGCDYVLRF